MHCLPYMDAPDGFLNTVFLQECGRLCREYSILFRKNRRCMFAQSDFYNLRCRPAVIFTELQQPNISTKNTQQISPRDKWIFDLNLNIMDLHAM